MTLSPALAAAYDQLIGPGRRTRRAGVGGTVPVRFPSEGPVAQAIVSGLAQAG